MHSSLGNGLNRPSTILLLAIVALVGYQSLANRAAPPTLSPAVVATVNLDQVFKGLNVKTKADNDLKVLATDLNDKALGKEKELKQLKADLDDHQPGSPAYQQIEQKAVLAAEQYKGFMDFCKAKIDIEQGRTLRRIYLDIKKAAQQMADSNGYDIVFVDDSQAELPTAGQEETNRQISARRMLYVSRRIDITDALVVEMNKGQAPAGAAAGAAPTTKTP